VSLFSHLCLSSCLVVGLASAVAVSFGAPVVVGLVGLVACAFVVVVCW